METGRSDKAALFPEWAGWASGEDALLVSSQAVL